MVHVLPRDVGYVDLLLGFAKIGGLMFGGVLGGIGLMHRELVEVRGWLTEEEFLEICGVAQSVPGPVTVNTALLIGYRLGGVPGSLVALLGLLLAPTALTLVAATALSAYAEHWVARAALRGVSAAVLAMFIHALAKAAAGLLIKGGSVDLVAASLVALLLVLLSVVRLGPVAIVAVAAVSSLLVELLRLMV